MPFEIQFLKDLQFLTAASPWMVGATIFFARWCIFLNLIIAFVLCFQKDPRKRHAVYEAVWSFLCALAITTIVALIVERSRPFLVSSEILRLIPPPLTTSFPSAHTATAVAIACSFVFASRTAGWVSLLIAAFVAFGRMGAGVHFPTDILAGMFVGIISFAVVRRVHQQLRHS